MLRNSKLIASKNNTDLVLVNKREERELDSEKNSKLIASKNNTDLVLVDKQEKQEPDSKINSEINSKIDSNTRTDLDEKKIISKEGWELEAFKDGYHLYKGQILPNNKFSIREDSTNLPSSPANRSDIFDANRSDIFDLKDDVPSTPAKSHEHTEKLNNVATRILDAFFGKPDNSPIKPTLPNINNKDKSPGK